jgi:IclR family transcriptional regulator, KDG regulon repressor
MRENTVQSVDRALQLIDIVSQHRNGCGVTELAHALDISKSTVFRLVSSLVNYGYIEQHLETKNYKLGYKLLELNTRLLDSIDLRTQALPFLKELEDLSNEVVHLVVPNGGEVVYIEKLEGNETLRMHSQVGKRAPMHCTGVGKVILAYLAETTLKKVIKEKGLPKITVNTIDNEKSLYTELNQIRKQGFGYDLEENEIGISCIAAPIFNHKGEITAALSISGPTLRMTDEKMANLKGTIVETCSQISKRLGF